MAPRVSIITIFLDEERFLGEAIDSVRAQTFHDWELILVDDGSTDCSKDIALAAATAEPSRIRYLQHPNGENRGMSASRNLGIARAEGEFVAFIDGDDVWLPGKLADQVAVFERHPDAELVYGRTLIWHSWRSDDPRRDFCYPLGVVPDRLYHPYALFAVLVRNRAQTPTTLNAMMRLSLVDRVGGFVDSFKGMFEDQAFFAKAHLAAASYVDDRVWARYRQHDRSCTARLAGTDAELGARRNFLDWLTAYVKDRGHTRFDVRLALLRARVDYHYMQVLSSLRRWLDRTTTP